MSPLLIVIITFGLLFVISASLANGLSITMKSVTGPMKGHGPLTIMLLISNFVILPALLIGLAAILPYEPQVKMAIAALALSAGAPFIPWLVSLAKGNLGYSVSSVIVLTLATFVVLPIGLPLALSALGTGAAPSAWLVLWPMLLFMAIPIAVGMYVRARYPQLAAQGAAFLGPLSVTCLLVHIMLFIGYTWSDVVSLAGGGVLAFSLVFPVAGMLVGYLLSPPYVLTPLPPENPHRGSKIVSVVAVAQQNTGAAICVAIFALGKYTVAGDMILVGAIVTIIVVMLTMAELGFRFAKKQAAMSPQDGPTATQAPASS